MPSVDLGGLTDAQLYQLISQLQGAAGQMTSTTDASEVNTLIQEVRDVLAATPAGAVVPAGVTVAYAGTTAGAAGLQLGTAIATALLETGATLASITALLAAFGFSAALIAELFVKAGVALGIYDDPNAPHPIVITKPGETPQEGAVNEKGDTRHGK